MVAMRARSLPLIVLSLSGLVGLTACNAPPRDSFQQWVARDAWDQNCAEQGMVERWSTSNAHWKIKGEVYVFDVDATFKLANECKTNPAANVDLKALMAGGGGAIRMGYKQFETVTFKKTVEMSKCVREGATGWSLPGKESQRCWTGPTLLPK